MNQEKEVYFGQYCMKCTHKNCSEDEDPCCDCLESPSNLDSHKPVRFKEKENA